MLICTHADIFVEAISSDCKIYCLGIGLASPRLPRASNSKRERNLMLHRTSVLSDDKTVFPRLLLSEMEHQNHTKIL